jgi:hypothetical protein
MSEIEKFKLDLLNTCLHDVLLACKPKRCYEQAIDRVAINYLSSYFGKPEKAWMEVGQEPHKQFLGSFKVLCLEDVKMYEPKLKVWYTAFYKGKTYRRFEYISAFHYNSGVNKLNGETYERHLIEFHHQHLKYREKNSLLFAVSDKGRLTFLEDVKDKFQIEK